MSEPTAGPGHNSKQAEEAERVQLLSVIAQVQRANEAVEAAKAPFDAAKKSRTTIFRLAKAAGFTRAEIEKRMEEMESPSTDMAIQAEREARHRRWLGILTPEQIKAFTDEGTPQEARDGVYFNGEGHKAGLRGLEAKPPKEVPERFVQEWMRGHESGTKTSLEAIAAIAPKLTGGAQAVREQAKADFAADNGVDPEIPSVPDPAEVDKAAKKQAEAWGVGGKAEGAGRNKPVNLAK